MRFAVLATVALLPAMALAAPAEEVPFIVSPDNVTLAMLQLARVGPEDYVLDLGSGDGRIVLTAAKRFGARGMGVEIVPELVEKSRAAARAMNLEQRAHFREQDLFKTDLSTASVITMYLLPEVNLQLRPKLAALRPGTRIVSHDWDLAEWEPDKTISVDVPDKSVGREKSSRIHLWVVPANIQGDWCGTGKHKGIELRLAQSFQKYRAQVNDPKGQREFEGRINAYVLRGPQGLNLTFDGNRIKATWAAGKYSDLKNATFARSRGPTCK